MSHFGRILAVVLLGAGLFASPASAASDSQIIFPAGTSGANADLPAAKPAGGVGFTGVLAFAALAGASGWMLWRGRKVKLGNRDARLLAIDETRSLGNRQYLVVASYEGKKLLLGVCPGRIDLLASLNGQSAKEDGK